VLTVKLCIFAKSSYSIILIALSQKQLILFKACLIQVADIGEYKFCYILYRCKANVQALNVCNILSFDQVGYYNDVNK